MSSSSQFSPEELAQGLADAEAEVSALHHVYVIARNVAIAALLKRRDFDYCRQQGIVGREDEDLNVANMYELNQAKSTLARARESYLQAERKAWAIRRAMRQD
jgi:hypothetical protein